MKIEVINIQTIKVILKDSDMQKLKINYIDMDYDDPDTKNAIISILCHVKEEKNINLMEEKLFIEAFPTIYDGCILYINILSAKSNEPLIEDECNIEKKSEFNTPLIFTFHNLDYLSEACSKVDFLYDHIILKNSLYHSNETYYLLIYTYFKLDDKIINIVKEYGSYLGKGNIKCAFVKEHCKNIINQDAIKKIIELNV